MAQAIMIFSLIFPIGALISKFQLKVVQLGLIFPPTNAAAGIRTHVCRVALTRDPLKDAQPTELPRPRHSNDKIIGH